MDARTLKALKASIEKWERNAVAETPGDYKTGSLDCPLCEIYFDRDCDGCPVQERTDETRCDGSPYPKAWAAWNRWQRGVGSAAAAHAAAREEVAFLKSLLPEEST